jgi:VanZ family protein
MGLPRTAVTAFRLSLIAALMIVTHLATTSLLYPVLEDINDKVGHSSAFFVLAFLADFSFPHDRFGLSKVFALLSYGLLIEVIQYFLPYRTFSMLDLAADGIGIAVYYLSLPALRHVPLLRRRWKTGPED